MFKCHECGTVFDRPKVVREDRGEFWGAPAFETCYYCPVCGGWDYDEYTGEDDWEEEDE